MINPNDRIVLKAFGENIQKIRKEKKLTLRQMEALCGLDNTKIKKIEKGLFNLTYTSLLKLADGLDVHASELFDYDLKLIRR